VKSVKRREEERKRNGCQEQQPCCLVQQCVSNVSGERKWSSSSMCVVTSSLSIFNNIGSSTVDVGDLPNHVKYCVSVLSLQWVTIRTSPIEIPNNWYQSIWFKVVFDFFPKMKVVKMMFWPYHYVEEEERSTLVKTTQNSDVGHDRTCQHARERRLPTRADAPHASSSLGWADLTRIPDDLIHVTDLEYDDVNITQLWRHHAQLACHVSDTSAQWDPPTTSSVVSRAALEPSRELRDRIQCSWSYVQSDLRLNQGRSLGQNCFDQILAV